MAHGKSLLLRYMHFKPTEDRPPVVRDRTLRGKARRIARKAANKVSR